MNTNYPWDILLIGGHSTSGKSIVAHELGRRLVIPVLQADDFRLALQRATKPGELDGLHFFRDPNAIRSAEPDDLVAQLIRVGEIVSNAIEAVIAHHVVARTPIIIEGDGLLPRLAAQTTCDDAQVAGRMRAVFVIESDEIRFQDAWKNRWPGTSESEDAWRWRRMAWKYGQWLEQEAKRLGVLIVSSSLFESLVDRVAAALEI